MKIHVRLIVVITIFFAGITQIHANGIDFNAIDDYVRARMRATRIPGVGLAIVKGDQVVCLTGYGKADSSGRAVTPQTSFIIGSVTKSFTALAVMQLVEAGKVELDTPVMKYIAWFRVGNDPASFQITVRQLLYQTSGLPMIREPQIWVQQDQHGLERSVRMLQDAKLLSPPGTSFAYSNSNYEALGLIVQMVSGMSYEDYIKQKIFAPLEMRNSFVSQTEAIKHGMAEGNRWWFGFPVPFTSRYKQAELPAGYLISSAEDMSHFVIAEMNGGRYRNTSVLSPAGIALTHKQPAPNTYGMGWESVRINGRTLINHDGGNENFQSSVFFDPQERLGVFVAANVMSALDAFSSPHGSSILDGSTIRAMAQSILSIAANDPIPDQGLGIRRLYTIFDLVLLALSIAVVVSLWRIPALARQLAKNGKISGVRIAWIVLSHFVLPLLFLFLMLKVPIAKILTLMQPDLAYWLLAVALVVFLKGVIEITLFWHGRNQSLRNGIG